MLLSQCSTQLFEYCKTDLHHFTRMTLKLIITWYSIWNAYSMAEDGNNMTPSNINATFCSHFVYSYVNINSTFDIQSTNYDNDITNKGYTNFTALRSAEYSSEISHRVRLKARSSQRKRVFPSGIQRHSHPNVCQYVARFPPKIRFRRNERRLASSEHAGRF